MSDDATPLSSPTRLMHWTIAVLVIGMLAFGLYLENMPRGAAKGALVGWHVSFGILVLVLASLRILWRMKEGFPKALPQTRPLQRKAAMAAHLVLLAGTILMPVSGIMMNLANGSGLSAFGIEIVASMRGVEGFERNAQLRETAGMMHGLGGRIMIAVILLHLAAAIKHHVIDKDATLRRMMGVS